MTTPERLSPESPRFLRPAQVIPAGAHPDAAQWPLHPLGQLVSVRPIHARWEQGWTESGRAVLDTSPLERQPLLECSANPRQPARPSPLNLLLIEEGLGLWRAPRARVEEGRLSLEGALCLDRERTERPLLRPAAWVSQLPAYSPAPTPTDPDWLVLQVRGALAGLMGRQILPERLVAPLIWQDLREAPVRVPPLEIQRLQAARFGELGQNLIELEAADLRALHKRRELLQASAQAAQWGWSELTAPGEPA